MEPSLATIKTLFALSCNHCYYEGCEEKLTDPKWQKVKAEIAHICGQRPGSARYREAGMTDEQRHDFGNLMLLCPNHHTLIDDLEPDEHPPDKLRAMKEAHISQCEGKWATEEDLEHFAVLLMDSQPGPRPNLVFKRGDSDPNTIDVVNYGDADATHIRVDVPDDVEERYVDIAAIPPPRLAPDEAWRAGSYLLTSKTYVEKPLSVYWTDEAGKSYSITVDLIRL